MTSLQAYDTQPPLPDRLVLIVDDEDDIHYLMSGILKKLHIHALFTNTIHEGLKMTASYPSIDLVFLDNHLPDGLGSEYIHLFKDNSNRHVVIVSAFDSGYDRIMAENNGADGFIGKPFTREQIIHIVQKLLSASTG